MTSLDEPAAPDPGGRLFEHSLDDLADVGVRLSREQRELYRECAGRPGQVTAMTLTTLTDPFDHYRQIVPLEVWDEELNDTRLVLYPQAVTLDWSYYVDHVNTALDRYTLDVYEPEWRRFPSLPGRRREVNGWDPAGNDLSAVEGFRLWSLWPLPPELVAPLEEAVSEWMAEDYLLIGEIAALDSGDWTLCEWAESNGHGALDTHVHFDREGRKVGPEHDQWSAICQTGELALDDWLDSAMHEHGGRRYFKPFPGPRLGPETQAIFDRLYASALRNSAAAMSAYPAWQQDYVYRSEKEYSPWLSS